MGHGRGKSYALIDNNKVVSAIQVKWKSLKEKTLEVSRFCSTIGTTVVGGYSKLLKHVEDTNQPKKIITFVDERYGSGDYLLSLGFQKQKSHISFSWTDGTKTYHRMMFPGNTGYKNGCFKIWDCGQVLFVKEISNKS